MAMQNQFSRIELMLGSEALTRLKNSRVAIFGIGGVGSYTAEALARSGIGALDLIDNDTVCITNINRQLYATLSTVGKYKVDAARERIGDINTDTVVRTYKTFYMPENADSFDLGNYDYVVDAIDTVTAKLELAQRAANASVPIISAMGAGNKMNPAMLEVADIYETSVCPLARVMRYELKKRGIKAMKVVYSKEKPLTPAVSEQTQSRKPIPGSNAFVPPVAGLIMAGEIVKDLTGYVPSLGMCADSKEARA